MNPFFTETMNMLNNALNSLKEEAFEKLVQNSIRVLDSGHKIIVSGLGKNVPVCEKFIGTMSSLGLNAFYMNTNSAVHGDIGMVHEGDMVIILTKSGKTVESVYLFELLKKRNCEVWLLTFAENSLLAQEVPNVLAIELEHEGDKWNIMPNNSTTVNLIVLQTLAMEICKRKNIGLEVFKKNHPGGYIGEALRDV